MLVESNMPNSKPSKDAFTKLHDTISSSLDVRNGQILGFMSFYIIYESVNENINFF